MTQFASTLYPQTNPTNHVLLAAINGGGLFVNWSPAQIEHARRVLTRLASLS